MPDREPQKRKSSDPFSVFLTGAADATARAFSPLSPEVGTELVWAVRHLLAEGSSSAAQLELSRNIDRSAVAALLYLADEEEHRIGELGTRLEISERRVQIAVYSLAENGLVEIINENRENEAAKLTPRGRAMIVQISEIVMPR